MMYFGGGEPVGSPDAPGSDMAKRHRKVRIVGYVLSAIFAIAMIIFIIWLT